MTATQEAPVAKPDDVAPPRLPSLTALRFFAAFLVFNYHAAWLGVFKDASVGNAYKFVAANAGQIGVSFFFVLSGFVLAWTARTKDSPRRFWRRRLVKIFPNHVVVFAGALILMPLAGLPVTAPQAIANLFLVHAWIPDMSYQLAQVNHVTWSLSVELFFYLLFPAIIVLVRKIRPEHLWRWAIVIGAIVTLIPLIQPLLPTQPVFPAINVSWPEMWAFNFAPVTRLFEFAFGMLLARIVRSGRWIRMPALPALLLVCAAYGVSLYAPSQWTFAALFGVPLGLLIAAVAVKDIGGRPSWLRGRPMVWLGEISFAFFLAHFTLLWVLDGAMSGRIVVAGVRYQPHTWGVFGGALFLLGALVVTIVVSWVIYRLVEVPAMRRWARSRTARDATRLAANEH